MIIPFIKDLQGYIGQRLPPKFRFTPKYEFEECSPTKLPDGRTEYIYEVKLQFKTILDSKLLQMSDELRYMKGRAIQAIAHELYGPVQTELKNILILCWEENMQNDPIAIHIQQLITDLYGETNATY